MIAMTINDISKQNRQNTKMKKFATIISAVAISGIAALAEGNSPVEYVNPLVGTQSTYELSTGNTYPAIARPWGMNFWTPQTGKMGDGWAYTYTATKIRGFKQTHQPSPWINDYGQFSIMPVVGEPTFDENKRASWFSHKSETAKPYYYSVYLAEHDVTTEIAPTERAAMFRFTFPESDNSYVVIDAFDNGSRIKVIPAENKIIGYTTKNSGGVPDNFKNYFVITFDKPLTYTATFADGVLSHTTEQQANHVGAVIGFKTAKGERVHARVASSFISAEQAEINLRELGNSSFDGIVEQGRDAWNKELGKIEVSGGSTDQLRTFYSCMYRSLLFPRKFYEIDAAGKIVHYSPFNGEVCDGYLFTDTGFWDTFRSLFPFLNLMYPSMAKEMQEGLINTYKESGFFPEWASPGHRGCMVGNNSASVLVDAYIKGIKVDDVNTLYEGLIHGTQNVHPTVNSTGRLGWEYYNKLGYVPYDVNINENAARTLEYAYDDWCILQLAKKLGRPQKEQKLFAARAMNYKNLFDKETCLMRGKNKDGKFMSPFSPLKWGDAFTEGNSWHYTWSVFHDPQGLINLMGGKQKFVAMLDSVFAVPPVFDESYYGQVIHEIREMQIMGMGNYAHGNQPIQHMIYLYNYAGQPWKAQYWLRQVMNRMYTPYPDGYCGDEDNGQTSAWYVFSALGFYPVAPGTTQYIVGAPLFKNAVLHFDNGKTLTISAPQNSTDNIYIQSMQYNGVPYTKNYFEHFDMLNGGRIDIEMTATPNTTRGTADADRPYSFSLE
jgi:predicted alpha-1,2-mannosidase